jgi:hypothetical protein
MSRIWMKGIDYASLILYHKNVHHYKNNAGSSDVVAYGYGARSITVEFRDGSIYLYNYKSAGAENIDEMKKLAQAGEGLDSFIDTVVKEAYSIRVR